MMNNWESYMGTYGKIKRRLEGNWDVLDNMDEIRLQINIIHV
jgi:hypothetical protein